MVSQPSVFRVPGHPIRHLRILRDRAELETRILAQDTPESIAEQACARVRGDLRPEALRRVANAYASPVGWFSMGRPAFENACRLLRLALDTGAGRASADPVAGSSPLPGVMRVTGVRPSLSVAGRFYDVRVSVATGPLSGWGGTLRMSDKYLLYLIRNKLGGRKFGVDYSPADAVRCWFCGTLVRGLRGIRLEVVECVSGQLKWNKGLLAVRGGKCIRNPGIRCLELCPLSMVDCRYGRWPATLMPGVCKVCGRELPLAVAGCCLSCIRHGKYRIQEV